jgi:hypothetical protein
VTSRAKKAGLLENKTPPSIGTDAFPSVYNQKRDELQNLSRMLASHGNLISIFPSGLDLEKKRYIMR